MAAASSNATIQSLQETLCAETSSLALRYRALFSLKHLAQHGERDDAEAAIAAIAAAFPARSALLKHELAYCLGQSRNLAAAPYLQAVLEDREEHAMFRHEAAEALGALSDQGSLDLLRRLRDREDEISVVRETCDIALDRIEWEHSEQSKQEKMRPSPFLSIDPAPPMPESVATVEELEKILLDEKQSLFTRYRAMFSLRDLASPHDLPTAVPAVHALAKGFKASSALFRHEIAFVFGQLAHPASIPALTDALGDMQELDMVRHEAAEALGNLGDVEGVEDTLKRFLTDPHDVVRESVVVALDISEYEKGEEKEYALIPEVAGAA